MKNFVIGFLFVGILMLTSCTNSKNDEMVLEKIEFSDLDQKVESYIQLNIQDNGFYLINNNGQQYLLLSKKTVINGEAAGYFSNIVGEVSEDKLMIYFDENFVEEYNDKRLKDNMVIYLIKDANKFEYIIAHKNGIEVPFDSIIGI